jgi:hypothetical protein
MRKHLVAAIVGLPLPFVTGVASASPFTNVGLGLAGSSGLNLSVFVTGGTFQGTNPATTITGNAAFAAGVTQSGTSDGRVTGTLYYDTASSLAGIGNFNKNGTFVQTSLTQAVADVQNAALAAAALIPDQTINGDVGASALTLSPSGIDTVVQINGNINISNSSNDLTISGGPNDFYIINVAKNVTLTNGAITTTGGIPASHILFNLFGTNATLTTQTSTSEAGTFLLPFSGDQIFTHGNGIDGALIGFNVSMTSGTSLNGPVFGGSPPPLPEPASLGLLGMGAIGMLARRRRA